MKSNRGFKTNKKDIYSPLEDFNPCSFSRKFVFKLMEMNINFVALDKKKKERNIFISLNWGFPKIA